MLVTRRSKSIGATNLLQTSFAVHAICGKVYKKRRVPFSRAGYENGFALNKVLIEIKVI